MTDIIDFKQKLYDKQSETASDQMGLGLNYLATLLSHLPDEMKIDIMVSFSVMLHAMGDEWFKGVSAVYEAAKLEKIDPAERAIRINELVEELKRREMFSCMSEQSPTEPNPAFDRVPADDALDVNIISEGLLNDYEPIRD